MEVSVFTSTPIRLHPALTTDSEIWTDEYSNGHAKSHLARLACVSLGTGLPKRSYYRQILFTWQGRQTEIDRLN
jgi:hypothetical protein